MKRFFPIFIGVLIGLALCALGVSAQKNETKPPTVPKPKILTIGVINGKAISLPAPEYPPAAKAVGVTGAVNVQISIDEKGDVLSAKAVSGHPLLRNNAEKAALQAKFPPTLLEGKPVKITGIVVYNFTGRSLKDVKIVDPLDAPNPEYPPAARAVNATGKVHVLVTVNEKGEVVSAEATSGHPLLRRASEKAAGLAKFKPVSSKDEAGSITTVLTYEFTASGETRFIKK